ncbi:hypothetical protein RB653_008708 [Dictyostelium firmibasis]|uniref:Transglycosylase SLT domain-containing protein n=1 Tax=Dictyostelium firmibasis TaxID=79012 RepID=A0AAN7U550_9MYCE
MFKKLSLIGCFAALAASYVNGQAYSCSQITSLAQQYFNSTSVLDMVCISFYESSWNPQAVNPSGATGLWQIMEDHCQGICQGICTDQQSLFDPNINAQCALAVLEAQGLYAWTTYDDGDCTSWDACSNDDSLTGSYTYSGSNTGTASGSGSGSVSGTYTGYSGSVSGTGSGASNRPEYL